MSPRPPLLVPVLLSCCAGVVASCGKIVPAEPDATPSSGMDAAPDVVADASSPALADAAPDVGDASPTSCVDVELGSALGDAVFAGSTVGLPDDFSGCDGLGGGDVFLSWTAPSTGRFDVTTCGSNYDTTLGALMGSCGGPLVACNDDSNACFNESVQSSITLDVQEGELVILVLDGFEDDEGNALLNIIAR